MHFSYHTDRILKLKLDTAVELQITRVDTNVARLYFVDERGFPIPVPDEFTLYEAVSHSRVPVHNSEFLITWTGSYELKRRDATVLRLDSQRQQAIRCARGSFPESYLSRRR